MLNFDICMKSFEKPFEFVSPILKTLLLLIIYQNSREQLKISHPLGRSHSTSQTTVSFATQSSALQSNLVLSSHHRERKYCTSLVTNSKTRVFKTVISLCTCEPDYLYIAEGKSYCITCVCFFFSKPRG